MEWNGLTELPAIHDAADQHAVRGRVARWSSRRCWRFLFGVITFKRHIYGVYCAVITLAEVTDPAGIHHRISGLHRRIQRHHRLLELRRRPVFLWFILAVTVVFLHRRARAHAFADRHRAQSRSATTTCVPSSWATTSPITASSSSASPPSWRRPPARCMRPGSGIVSFLDAGPVFSIEAVIWTAVGGRGTIIGPFVGTFLVQGRGVPPERHAGRQFWQLIMGGLFIFVVLCIPRRHSRHDRPIGAQAASAARFDRSSRKPIGARMTGSTTGSRRARQGGRERRRAAR